MQIFYLCSEIMLFLILFGIQEKLIFILFFQELLFFFLLLLSLSRWNVFCVCEVLGNKACFWKTKKYH